MCAPRSVLVSSIALFLAALSGISCANRFRVVALNPATPGQPFSEHPGESGFVYRLPQPYLVITNTKLTVAGANTPDTAGGNSPTNKPKPTPAPAPAPPPREGRAGHGADLDVAGGADTNKEAPPPTTATIVYLPSDRVYAVKMKTGPFGTFKGSITLQNGWMLTAVNQEYDTKGTETVTAFAGLLGTILKGVQAFNGAAPPQKPFFCMYKIDIDGGFKLTAVSTSDKGRQNCEAIITAASP